MYKNILFYKIFFLIYLHFVASSSAKFTFEWAAAHFQKLHPISCLQCRSDLTDESRFTCGYIHFVFDYSHKNCSAMVLFSFNLLSIRWRIFFIQTLFAPDFSFLKLNSFNFDGFENMVDKTYNVWDFTRGRTLRGQVIRDLANVYSTLPY